MPKGRLAEPLSAILCGMSNADRLSSRLSSVPTSGVLRRLVATLEPSVIRSSTFACVYEPLKESPLSNDFCSCTDQSVDRSALLLR